MSTNTLFPIKVQNITISSEEYERVVSKMAKLEQSEKEAIATRDKLVKFLKVLNSDVLKFGNLSQDFFDTDKYEYSFQNNMGGKPKMYVIPKKNR